MHRALAEFRVRGVVTNLRFLDQLITHARFARGEYTTRFIDDTPELFRGPRKRDRATRLLSYLGALIVNGNDETRARARPRPLTAARLPPGPLPAPAPGTKQKLDELGPERFAAWMLAEQRVLLTDTTMRDAHQSLLATRVRTLDMTAIAPYYASLLPELFSVECWGGATFDVALRFLREDPWQRLTLLRERLPNLLLQMLLRSANAVGYANYPDNVERFFVTRTAQRGIDLFRNFDSLHWVVNVRVAIDAVAEAGKLSGPATCYSGNLRDPRVDPQRLRVISSYWEQVRRQYAAFESDIRAGASEVYVHGMPGGQYTNLREQARALGIDEARWPEVAGAYAEVNSLFGDIVKVTPTSKAVGDLALLMVTAGLTREQVLDPDVEVAFPEAVVEFFRGSPGQPYGGFPPGLQSKVLKGAAPLTGRPGATLPSVDLTAERASLRERLPREVTDDDLASYLMYPRVWLEYAQERALYGDAAILPTPVFFYGMAPGQEISVDLERGKTLIVRYGASRRP